MRMVACDLDGTIVRQDGTVSRRTTEALRACERSGVQVVFVTGRPPRWVLPVAEATGHQGLALCGNGAAVLDLRTGEVVESRTLSVLDVVDAATRLRYRLPGPVFAVETMSGFRWEPQFETRHADGVPTGSLAELLTDYPPVLKLLVKLAPPRHGTVSADEMLRIGRDALAGLCEVAHSDPAGGMIEVAPLGVTKASALERLAASQGIDRRDVVAFGDMPNDVEMLAWAGAGYAMQGGHPDAVDAAPQLAPPCEQDGVAQVIERLLFSPSGTAVADAPAPSAPAPSKPEPKPAPEPAAPAARRPAKKAPRVTAPAPRTQVTVPEQTAASRPGR